MHEEINWAAITRDADLLSLVEKDAPLLAGTFNGRYTIEVPCPKCGGRTRFRVRLRPDGVMRAYCSHCAEKGLNAIDYLEWRDGLSRRDAAQWWQTGGKLQARLVRPRPEPIQPIDMAIAERNHQEMPASARDYLRRRGMTDPWIDHFRIGYHCGYRRYSFPFITARGAVGMA